LHRRQRWFFGSAVCLVTALTSAPAFAHHLMGGQVPATFTQGVLSGLGHPVIGIDHLAAIIGVGILASAFRPGAALVIGYVLAQMAGAAVHMDGITVPGVELLVAISVLLLGAAVAARRAVSGFLALALFVIAGSVHGYALAESIVGAEPQPLIAYFAGLVVVQIAIALAAMLMARRLVAAERRESVRLAGAVILGIGLAVLAQQIVPTA
jgi:urease accessory protein